MGAIQIKRITGFDTHGPVIQNVVGADSLEYHGEWMADEFVSVNVKSPAPVDFNIDDFIEYRGDVYALGYDPNVTKKASRNTYGEGFAYDTIRLQSLAMKLKGYGFKDYVLDDNGMAYSSLGTFSFFAGSIEDLADRLQANINRQDIGIKTNLMQMYSWKVVTPNWSRCYQRGIDESDWETFFDDPDTYGTWGSGSGVTLGETDVNIDVDDNSSYDILKYSYTKFGLTWYTKVSGTVIYIVIGGAPIVADKGDDSRMIFRYGRNLGLYEIERTAPDDQELVTRMFAYGSDKNIPLNYYANVGKKIKFQVSQKRELAIVGSDTEIEIWIAVSWDSVSAAFAPNYEVMLTCGNKSARFAVSHADDEEESQVQSNTTTYLTFTSTEADEDAMEFFNYVDVGDYIYVTSGADMNVIPSEYIEIPQDYNYPALLSVSKLMLPGFPEESLKEWVCDKAAVDDTEIRESIGPNTIEEVPDLPSSVTNYQEKNKWRRMLRLYAFSTDKYDPWVMSGNAQYAGVIEGTANFDGTHQTEIYPTIEGTGYNEIAWGSLTFVTDNGYVTDGGNFSIFMSKEDGLDWKALFGTRGSEDVKICMKSGYCIGVEFELVDVKDHEFQQGEPPYCNYTYELICKRVQDSSGRWQPYSYADGYGQFHVLRGDTFVVTGVEMPKEFIDKAAERLLIASCGWLDRRDHVRYTYLPKVDNIYMARQDEAVKEERDESVYGTVSLHDTLRAGMRMEFEDAADLGIERYGAAAPFIDVLTIREDGGDGIPSYDVVLRDEKERGVLEKMAERIEELTGATNIVERTTRGIISVDYQQWEAGALYYHEAMNVEFDRLEQSYVWHKGKKWMCMRTYTTEEPGLGCEDWVVVEGDQTFQIKFYDNNVNGYAYGESVLVRRGHINVPLWPFVLWGTEDVTAKVSSWQWRRTVAGTTVDFGTSRNITVTDQSLPDTWSAANPATFTCTATIVGVDTQITNILTV